MYSAIVMPTKRVHKFSSISSGLCALSSNYGVEAFWIRYTEGLLGRISPGISTLVGLPPAREADR